MRSGSHHTEETREKLRQLGLGKTLPIETRQKISLSLTGRVRGPMGEEQRNKCRLAHIGMKLSEEHKRKIGLACRGKRHYGVKAFLETRAKMSLSQKKRTDFSWKPGRVPWNKGIKWAEMTGENRPLWKGGVTSRDRLERVRFRRTVQKLVFERDDYTCQICGGRGGSLQVDHIQKWVDCVEGRFDIDNCRTVCMDCHYKITFGKPKPKGIKAWGHNLKYFKVLNG